jgi:hypothetical protein
MRLLCIGFALSVFAAACGSDSSGEEAFDTYQDCFDEHTMEEGLDFQEAVVVCCIDHEIDGHKLVCGDTAADCVTYLGDNLSTSGDIQAACDEYETQKDM